MRRSRLRLKRQLPTVESFDLTGLSGVFNQATNAGEATVAFEVTGDPGVISQLIKRLKQNQITCVWTSEQKRAKDFHVNI